ncbi:MAG: phosphatidylglycerophosphatase A [Desulfovibrio sp.]|jgi:phosphatidylglycerophosphatase A|nr:phosphatidylglycerophosphatase A [Desulfovibrio sp.]
MSDTTERHASHGQDAPRRSLADRAVLALCRLWIAGLSPWVPGTAGTAVACLLAPFCFVPLSFALRLLLLLCIFFAGSLAATRAERLLGRKDPGEVVVDELLGLWVVLLPFQDVGMGTLVAAFLFFRVFDILKPWPVSASENWLPGGYGIMIDDVLAGIYAMPCVALCRWVAA